MTMTPRLLPLSEVQKVLNISPATLYRLATKGDISIRKLGNKSVVLSTDVDAYLANLPVAKINSK